MEQKGLCPWEKVGELSQWGSQPAVTEDPAVQCSLQYWSMRFPLQAAPSSSCTKPDTEGKLERWEKNRALPRESLQGHPKVGPAAQTQRPVQGVGIQQNLHFYCRAVKKQGFPQKSAGWKTNTGPKSGKLWVEFNELPWLPQLHFTKEILRKSGCSLTFSQLKRI